MFKFNENIIIDLKIMVLIHLHYCIAENRAGPSNLGNVISQILLCKTIAPDFNQEEIHSIAKDSQELNRIVHEMQEFLPQQELAAGTPAIINFIM